METQKPQGRSPKPQKYTLKTTNLARSKLAVTPEDPSNPAYTFHLSYFVKDLSTTSKQHSLVLHSQPSSSSSTQGPIKREVLGVGDIDLLSSTQPLRLFFNDPGRKVDTGAMKKDDGVDLPEDLWHPIKHTYYPPSQSTSQPNSQSQSQSSPFPAYSSSAYELTITLIPKLGPRRLAWSRVHSGEGIGSITGKLDWLNLVLRDVESGEVLARFVHWPWYGWKRGYFEILNGAGGSGSRSPGEGKGEDVEEEMKTGKQGKGSLRSELMEELGEEWVQIVLLSGMGVVEYLRKVTGWSW